MLSRLPLPVLTLAAVLGACTADVDEPTLPDCSRAPVQSPEMARLPYLQSVTGNDALIAWGMKDGAKPASLRLAGPAGRLLGSEISGGKIRGAEADDILLQVAAVSGLEPGSEYCYEIVRDGERLAGPWSFRSAAAVDGEATFFVLGDYGHLVGNQAAVRDRMVERVDDIDFWVTTGDNAYPVGSWDQFQTYVFGMYGELLPRLPFYPTTGNHDYYTNEAEPYLGNFFLPEQALRAEDNERYYSFDWGAAHFVMLDTEAPLKAITDTADDDMADWLEADLKASDRPWKIVVFHRPPYTAHPDREPSYEVREKIVPILERNGVQVVLNGHNHFYERFHPLKGGERNDAEGITYIVTGGGGALLYPIGEDSLLAHTAEVYHFVEGKVSECRLSFTAVDSEGAEFDGVELDRCR